jgi:hypothetical protein
MTTLRPRLSFPTLLALMALHLCCGATASRAQSVPAAATQPPQQSAVPPSQSATQQPNAKPADAKQASAPDMLNGLRYRSIGPFRGGRVTAVAGVASQPFVYYFGATGGGVWKTVDGGVNWEPVSDEFFKTGSVGAIGVAESDPNVIYVGMGESPIRGNVSHGDGMYKTMDAGKRGRRLVLRTRATSPACACIRRTLTSFTSPRSGIPSARIRSAAFTAAAMVGRRGNSSFRAVKRQARLI